GSDFEITIVDNDQANAENMINIAIEEISRIEKLISSWDKNSQTSLINLNAGVKPVKIDLELFELISRSVKVSNLSQGAFDISYASMDKVWYFDRKMTEFPSIEKIKKSVSKIGYKNIVLNKEDTTVFLKLKGMKIGFGAIGKGYAADRAKDILIKNNVKSGIINASGDLTAWGLKPSGKDWMVAIVNPINKDKVFSWLTIKNKSIVTSGNYEKFINLDGKKYSHIIDPRTGYPTEGILSVTIITDKAELADALATSVFVLGVDIGLNMINQLNGVDCIIIDDNNKIIKSRNIEINDV
ncbi:MAG: thiamine biosynthesis protein ApbE, partial [Flavobacteriaceae bacterium]|nr:thiamine biosynthesis protein ApbE [Flavobacteriaceae bacterium]